MMKTIARVRRDGQAVEIDAEDLVPGDVVLVEAGNRIPADGRICVAATLEIEEAALTGESLPVGKSIEPVPGDDVPLGDRTCMAFMNTVGHPRPRRADRHRDRHGHRDRAHRRPARQHRDRQDAAAEAARRAVQDHRHRSPASRWCSSILLGLLRGESFDTLFITGVALAVAAIPTGLPAVVTALLSMGTREIARRNAIVKRLPAVETLGSTSAICSDKTGTLTLNKMTARELVDPGPEPLHGLGRGLRHRRARSSTSAGRTSTSTPTCCRWSCAPTPCSTARALIGDPTEGALIVLGAKGGLDIDETRAALPADRRGAVRLRVQVHGDLPRDDRRRRRAGRALLRQGRPRRPDRPRRRRYRSPGRQPACRSPTRTGTSPSRPTTGSPTPASG